VGQAKGYSHGNTDRLIAWGGVGTHSCLRIAFPSGCTLSRSPQSVNRRAVDIWVEILAKMLALCAAAFVFASVLALADDGAPAGAGIPPAKVAKDPASPANQPKALPTSADKKRAVNSAHPTETKPLMGDFPQQRDFGRPRSPLRQPGTKASTDEVRAERKRLVDQWEKTLLPEEKPAQ
jgi:hypothetical protein